MRRKWLICTELCLWKEILSLQRIRHFKNLQSIYFAYDVGIISSYSTGISYSNRMYWAHYLVQTFKNSIFWIVAPSLWRIMLWFCFISGAEAILNTIDFCSWHMLSCKDFISSHSTAFITRFYCKCVSILNN